MNKQRGQAVEPIEPEKPIQGEGYRRNKIIAALVSSIAEDGFDKTTIRSVATRAGVSPGLITYYFKDKEEMVSEAVRSALEEIARVSAEALLPYGSTRLEVVFTRYLRDGYPGSLPLGFWLQIHAAAATDAGIRAQVVGWMREGVSKVRRSVEAAMATGDYRRDLDPDIVARSLYALMTGLAVETSISADLLSPDRAVEIVLHALRCLDPPAGGEAASGHTIEGGTPGYVERRLLADPNLNPTQAASLAEAFRAMYRAMAQA